MPLLLAFGDSNTHGSPADRTLPPGPRGRHGADSRWGPVAARALGYDLVEEGLPGRTAQFADPVMGAHMDGRPALTTALASHGPLDWLAIMLGTNDVKTRFGADARRVTAGIAALLDLAQAEETQGRHGGFRILVICPPPVSEAHIPIPEFVGAEAVFRDLPRAYAALAAARGCAFLDAGTVCAVSPADGIHLDAPAQRALGEAVAATISG